MPRLEVKMKKIKNEGRVEPGDRIFRLEKKVNELVDYANKQEDNSKKYKKMADELFKMRKEEHKVTMDAAAMSKKMFEKIEKMEG